MTYRTDPEKLRAVVPDPLQIDEPLVEFEFIRMPDSTDFGDYTESGQVIPVRFWKETGGYSDAMYLNDGPPIFGPVLIATGTMGFKHVASNRAPHLKALAAPNFLLKIIPLVDGSLRICELVRYELQEVALKGA